jgi:FkbM family methyltransferase
MFDHAPAPVREGLWSIKHRAVRWMTDQGFVDSLHVLLQDQLRSLDITHVIDIGANRGQYGHLLRRLGFRGRIISFEPVRQCFDDLSELAKRDGNWEVHRLALGDLDGELEMNVTTDDVFSSLLQPNSVGRQMFPTESSVTKNERVPVRRLEPLLPGLVPRDHWSRTHLKSDAQGSEPAILRGLGDTLSAMLSLQIEVSLIGIYESQTDYQDVLRPLHDRGYRLTGFFPVSRDSSLGIVEADVLLRRA